MSKLGAWKGVLLVALGYACLGAVSLPRLISVVRVSAAYFVEMALIIPAIVLLMGLFEVWVSKDMIRRLLGRESGPKGMLLAFAMGTAPTGPLYAAFPIASSLIGKGASVSNVVVFLGAWAAAKVPQVAMEAKFLGLDFAVARFLLTAVSLAAMGLISEFILGREGRSLGGTE